MARRRLTDRQRERIGAIQEKRRARMAEQAEAALAEDGGSGGDLGDEPREGRVVARHGRNLVVEDGATLVHCLFRQNLGDLVCGDRVVWQPTGSGEGVVSALLPRSTVLARPDYSGRERPLAANIDQLVIVIAPQPEPSGFLVDQYLVTAEVIGVAPLIAVNKADLLVGEALGDFLGRFEPYRAIGYPLVTLSARSEHGLDPLRERLRGRTNILVGQSGVGKSSLIQALLPDQQIQVGILSAATGFGRHTTSTATCYRLPGGGELIDSPGVRGFRLTQVTRGQLEQGFREFRPFLGHCQFSDCSHQQEPGCAIKAALAAGAIHPRRLEHFLLLRQKG
jgi:ribosome biogenesis GTPase / thiamine phosphate phosphatase